MNGDFISVEEVAERCRLSHVTARKRLKAGEIPGRVAHHGGHRVDRETFEKWLTSEGSRKSR